MNKERLQVQNTALSDVQDERDRQDRQWGVQNHHPAYWLAILGKQVGQFGSAILNREWWTADKQDDALADMRAEAVQVAAVAVAIIEAIDAGNVPVGITTAKPSDPRQLARALGRDDESIRY